MVRVICGVCLCNKLEAFVVLEILLHSKQLLDGFHMLLCFI